jgi:hypothetical protein
MTAPNANVTIQFLAKSVADPEIARLDGELVALERRAQGGAQGLGALARAETDVASGARVAQRETQAVAADLGHVVAAGGDAEAALAAFTAQLAQPQSTEGFLQRVQDDVRTATADFKAGIISVEDYQVALSTARQQAIDQRKGVQLGGKELSLFSGIMDDTATRTQGATRSSRTLTTGLVSLAAQATGASGALGGVARVALLMGTGGLVAGALAAGVAAATALYEHWTAAAKEVKKAHDDLYASIEEAARGIIPKEIVLAQQRQQLEREGAELTRRRLSVETALNFERQKTISSHSTIVSLEAELERLQQAEVDRLVKLAQLRRISADESTKVFEKHRDELLLEAVLVGQDADMQFQLRLEAEHMTATRIAALVAIRQETLAHLDLVAAQRAELDFALQRRNILAAATPREPTIRGGRAPAGRPPAPAGPDTVGTEPLSAAEDLAHRMTDSFGLSIDMVEELGRSIDDLANGALVGLGDGFEAVFNAIVEGGKVSAEALLGGLLGAISKAAIHEAAYYTARGFAALAASWFPFPDPKNTVSAAQYFKAAALMGAVGVGAGVAAGAVGGGPGSAGGASREGATRNARNAQQEQGELRVVLKGSARVLARDPDFVQSVADSFATATGLKTIVLDTED